MCVTGPASEVEKYQKNCDIHCESCGLYVVYIGTAPLDLAHTHAMALAKAIRSVEEWKGDVEFVQERLSSGEWDIKHVHAYVEGLRHATRKLDPKAQRADQMSEYLKLLTQGLPDWGEAHQSERWKAINEENKRMQARHHGSAGAAQEEQVQEPPKPKRRVELTAVAASPPPPAKRKQRFRNPGKLPPGFALGSIG